jgi:predicted DNA-binding transcriptional regulator YafY
MERLVRLMAVLSAAGAEGVPSERLVQVAGFTGTDAPDQVAREFRHLRKQGWQIDNIAAQGTSAVWRLRTGDHRLRLRLDDRQQAALQRAVLLADRADLVHRLGLPHEAKRPEIEASVLQRAGGSELAAAMRSLQHRAVLSFRYNGKERRVHPASVRHQNNQWYLSGREDGADDVKHFVVARMSGVRVGEPGGAEHVEPVRRLALHPLRWDVDPATEVTIEVEESFVPDVVRWLQEPTSRDGNRLTYTVTHRAAMRARLYMLGERVRVVGPKDFRSEMLGELTEMAGV